MEQVLSGLHWETCLVYTDDIIIFSESVENHFHRLREVFTRLKAAGLKLKPTKCYLLHRSVKYLGHIVSANGVKTDPGKTVHCGMATTSKSEGTKAVLRLGIILQTVRKELCPDSSSSIPANAER